MSTALSATEQYLAKIERENDTLRAFITVDRVGAITAARAADERRARGAGLSPIDGLPIAIKDNIDVAGLPTTNGAEHWRHNIAASDAFVTARLRAAGAVILGKLNMHEVALGATTDNPFYGRCQNPRKPGFVPGGSSGGSAAAVAAGLCAAALGSDTLGSVRIPAAYCGVVGFKPTFGAISTRGVMPLAWTLDTVGVLAPSIAALKPVLEHARGFDREWPYARRGPRSILEKHARDPTDLRALRIGRPSNLDTVAIEPEIMAVYERTLAELARRGATVSTVDFSDYDYSKIRREALLLIEIEGAVSIGEAIDTDPQGFSDHLRKFIAYGAKQTAVRAAQSYKRLAEVRAVGRRTFANIDALVLPTAAQVAFAHGAEAPANQADLTSFASILGVPAGCVPVGGVAPGAGRNGLPVSMQVMASAFEDALVLDLLAVLETM